MANTGVGINDVLSAIGLILLVIGFVAIAIYKRQDGHKQQKEIVDHALREREWQQWELQQRRAALAESARQQWAAQQAATPQYCAGCQTVKHGAEMVWTLDGVYKCKDCV